MLPSISSVTVREPEKAQETDDFEVLNPNALDVKIHGHVKDMNLYHCDSDRKCSAWDGEL